MRLVFPPYALDLDRRLLLRGEEEIHISPKAFHFLRVLAESSPKALSKQQIFETVWPDVIVSEATLASVAAEIRAALGDNARQPTFMRTVHGYGYAFIAPVQTVGGARRPARSRFHLVVAGVDVPLPEGEHLVGRDEDATVVLADNSVSRRHARIVTGGDRAVLEDLASKNGTFVNGMKIDQPTTLHAGDVLMFGTVTVIFRDLGTTESTRTAGPQVRT